MTVPTGASPLSAGVTSRSQASGMMAIGSGVRGAPYRGNSVGSST